MEDNDQRPHPGENGFIVLLFCISIFALIIAVRISGFSSVSSPGTFPMIGSTVMVLTSLFLLIKNMLIKRKGDGPSKKEVRIAVAEVFRPAVLVFSGLIIIYMLLIGNINFLLSSFLFLVSSMLYLKGAGLIKAVIISVVTIAFIQVVFRYFFEIVLP